MNKGKRNGIDLSLMKRISYQRKRIIQVSKIFNNYEFQTSGKRILSNNNIPAENMSSIKCKFKSQMLFLVQKLINKQNPVGYHLPRSSPPEGLPTFSRRRCKSFGLNPSGGE